MGESSVKVQLSVGVGNPRPAAELALKRRLYAKEGTLKNILTNVAKGRHEATVATLRSEDGNVHGVCLIRYDGLIAIYVTPELRGRGWGGKLALAAIACTNVPRETIRAWPGHDFIKSVAFWKKNNIACNTTYAKVAMSNQNLRMLIEKGRVLFSEDPDMLPMGIFEALYLQELYSFDYSEKQNGIRGQLMSILGEYYNPLARILFHTDGTFFHSCATVQHSKRFVDGDSREIVEVQLYVKVEFRRQGLGQELLAKVKELYPDRTLYGYYNETSERLLERNGVIDIRTLR